jgi:outer membrane lipoprotein SlyB
VPELRRPAVAGGAERANDQTVGTAALGTALGTGLGAAVGGGKGAGIGAATGAVVGTAAASGSAAQTQYELQRRYDIAYEQCMYAKGNTVPGAAAAPFVPPPK